ncbi:MAG: hypothetical protein IJ168_05025 [Eubacterium sp.]|nr:hypothetical protein [Eubacterium sp.]
MVLEELEYKKKYSAPYAAIEMFTVKDVISTSGSQDDYDEEDDDNPFGTNDGQF